MGYSVDINLTCPKCGRSWSWQTRSGDGCGRYDQGAVAITVAAALDGVQVRCCEGYEGEDPTGFYVGEALVGRSTAEREGRKFFPAESARGCGAVFTIRSPEAVEANRGYPLVLEAST